MAKVFVATETLYAQGEKHYDVLLRGVFGSREGAVAKILKTYPDAEVISEGECYRTSPIGVYDITECPLRK